MVECIVNTLVKKFNITRDVAYLFYYELNNRRKLEHLISNVDKFKDFNELKFFYLGGK